MKKLIIITMFTLGCSDSPDIVGAEECEKYDTESACLDAGCPIFEQVRVVSYNNGECGENLPRNMCWTTETGDGLAQGVQSCYSRIETDGSRTIVFSGAGYSDLLGWALCEDPSLCMIE